MKKIIKKLEKLKKKQTPFCYSKEVESYNKAIDNAISLLKAIEDGKEEEFLISLIPANTGPR